MLVLVSGATRSIARHDVGHFIVPGQWNNPESLGLRPHRYAFDNGGFNGFKPGPFLRMLERFDGQPAPLFVAAPDVLEDAAATLDLWPFWSRLLRGLGLPVAFIAQDGLDPGRVPWDDMAALFIGGSTAYKESEAVRTLCGFAKAKGLWVHWGRVNSKRRYELAMKAGADSCDGTGFSWAPDINLALAASWEQQIAQQPELGL